MTLGGDNFQRDRSDRGVHTVRRPVHTDIGDILLYRSLIGVYVVPVWGFATAGRGVLPLLG